MNVVSLIPKQLNKNNFAEFGDVIEMDNSEHFPINDGAVERYHDLGHIQFDKKGRPSINIFKINKVSKLPYKFNLIECHPKGSQMFIPLFDSPVILVVGPKGPSISGKNLTAFITNGKQGFNFHSGVWHMPLISDELDRSFIVIDRVGSGNNCDELRLKNETIELRLT